MADEGELLKPPVLWAQRRDMILLRVQIQLAEKPDFNIYDTHMNFKGYGTGGSSHKKWYGFELVFHEPINTEKCRVKVFENEIEFRLLKKNSGEWSKLQSSHVKPHWIKLDFDHFHISEDEDDEDNDKMEELRKRKALQQELKLLEERTKREIELRDTVKDISHKVTATYLVIYNVVQFLGFLLISTRLIFLLSYGEVGISRAYSDVAPLLMACQIGAFLEVVHSALGFVKGDIVSSLLQTCGRGYILFLTIPYCPSLQRSPFVFLLFLAWSLIELVRYPYYALGVLKKEVWLITWLRYSLWIPLYPLGLTFELCIYVLSLLYEANGGGWSYPLPNGLNIAVDPVVMKVLIFISLPPVFYSLLSHMWSQRKRKLGGIKKRD
ncbi:PREDICTED: very-long-chain (3R)-3-hydroxyacyl-CoA dehydratase-like [Amphimedon queenslandica]|uniref:Very-long-chain (3R)-3-hydroxyacyl-CoA dehydratase n=1 Tax=Amphimedon queenslandica TaxID=400682 RepID=A0A1X7UK16_AMPQE|nr:PREDICTED: very-long-chain (3R)-3-hydroxyacyl-CoA dehydratase-like [Amphimedon queenslandica]|eukprot:XP_011404907.1 PREDICTED: very-long-chain (3R)-3-hydroxyacyl-CoA dehydratase-like [Amphimedon queenslandica]